MNELRERIQRTLAPGQKIKSIQRTPDGGIDIHFSPPERTMTDHEHVWVRHTPAAAFILLDADNEPFCSICKIAAKRCEYRSSITDVQCELIDGHDPWDATRFHKFSPPTEFRHRLEEVSLVKNPPHPDWVVRKIE